MFIFNNSTMEEDEKDKNIGGIKMICRFCNKKVKEINDMIQERGRNERYCGAN